MSGNVFNLSEYKCIIDEAEKQAVNVNVQDIKNALWLNSICFERAIDEAVAVWGVPFIGKVLYMLKMYLAFRKHMWIACKLKKDLIKEQKELSK